MSLTGTYLYARPNAYLFPQEETFTGTWEAGVLVSMDLWTWGRTRDQTQQARARVAEERARLDHLRGTLQLEVTRHVLNVERTLASVDATEQGLAAAQEAFRVLRAQAGQGMALTADVLDAETALRAAEARQTEARAQYAIAIAALQRATGQLLHE